MKNNEYWKKRFIALEDAQNKYSQRTYSQITPAFDKAEKQIQNQIEIWYQRFADNNGVSMQEARRLLNADELKELKWDVKEYIKYGKENAFSAEWMTELENASAKFHISRLEALKLRTQQALEVAYGNELDAIDGMLKKQFTDGYYHSCFELMRGMGVGWDIGQIDEKRLSRILSNPWAADGKTFSDRIWNSKTQMVNDLHQQLTRACLLGKAPDQTISSLTKYLKDKTKNTRYQAGRLVMTESAWIGSVAQQQAFNELDVEEFEVVATLDSHTSDICQEMDGKHFPMKEYQIGVTAPPFHVYCRSCTCPYFDDEFSIGERAARNEDGETYFVPENMKYPEWKEAFVDGGSKDGLIQIPQINDERMRSANEEFSQILLNSESTPHSDKMILYNGVTEYQYNENLASPFAYASELDVIQYNPNAPNYSLYDMNYVQAHELSHRMDILEYKSYNNNIFVKAIEKSKDIVRANSDVISSWFESGGKHEMSFAMSDIISALSNNEISVPIGHSNDYWNDYKNVCLEVFANISAMDVLADVAIEDLKTMFPDLFNAYVGVIQ